MRVVKGPLEELRRVIHNDTDSSNGSSISLGNDEGVAAHIKQTA